jgi:hypothetical protein
MKIYYWYRFKSFSLITTEERANKIIEDKVIDSLKISVGANITWFTEKKNKVKFGSKTLNQTIVYFDKQEGNENFIKKKFGNNRNAYLNNVVIIDYKTIWC